MAESKPRSLPVPPDNQLFSESSPVKHPKPMRRQRIKSRTFSDDNNCGNNSDGLQMKGSDKYERSVAFGEIVEDRNSSPAVETSSNNSTEKELPSFISKGRDNAKVSKDTEFKRDEIVSPVWGSPSTNSSSDKANKTLYSPKTKLIHTPHSSISSNSSHPLDLEAYPAAGDVKGNPNKSDIFGSRFGQSGDEIVSLDETEVSQSRTNSGSTQSSSKGRRKLRQQQIKTVLETELPSGISEEIDIANLEGDISVVTGNINRTNFPFSFEVNNQKSVSHPVGKCFVEQQGGFLVVDSTTSLPSHHHQDTKALPSPAAEFAVDVASRSQKHFHTFSLFCHGLLAGIALWQCIVVYKISPPNFSALDFIQHYSALSNPLQTCFYILLVICTVSVFDRYDIGRPHWSFVQGLILCRTGALTVFIYPITLFLSLSIKDIDDKFGLYNATMWENSTEDVILEVEHWKVMNLARCIGAILGWIIVSLQPSTSYFQDHLEIIAMQHGKQ